MAPEISTNSQNASHDDPVKAMIKLQKIQEIERATGLFSGLSLAKYREGIASIRFLCFFLVIIKHFIRKTLKVLLSSDVGDRFV
jgi:hypothetical protein